MAEKSGKGEDSEYSYVTDEEEEEPEAAGSGAPRVRRAAKAAPNLLLPRQGRNVPRLWTQARQIFRRLWSPYPMVLRAPRRNVESQVRRRVRMTQGRSYHQDPGALCARCRLWTHVLCGIGGGMMRQGMHGTGLRDRFRHLLI